MLRLGLIFALLLCPAWGAVTLHDAAHDDMSAAEVESMYAQAKATLEDKTITRVDNVPIWLETCTREGHAGAARLLMDVHEGKFKGLPANPDLAFSTVTAIADAPHPENDSASFQAVRQEAMFRLALYLEKGYGCEANPAAAYRCMSRAADTGMGAARVELARHLMLGKTTAQDPERAWGLLRAQAEADPATPHVFFYMGYMCYKGVGHKPDPRSAIRLFMMGAKMNDADCMNNLGAIFEKGITVKPDARIALLLYRKAAALGHRQASANMQRLAFKEGARATHSSGHTPQQRINNALQHIVQVLPLSDAHRKSLRARLNTQGKSTL